MIRIQWVTSSLVKLFLVVMVAGVFTPAHAHYQMLIPSDDVVTHKERRAIDMDIRFTHPFEGLGVAMEKPAQFGVWVAGKDTSLFDRLQEIDVKDRAGDLLKGYKITYKFRKPGDHIFYVVPQPYWDETEEAFLTQYTKVIVNTFGLEEGWDHELGMKAEIVPLNRPYGLWTNSLFQGIAKLEGKPVPFARVAVEYYNQDGKIKAPADPFITQIIRADANGVFTFAMPKSGWWGFSALVDKKTMKHSSKDYPHNIGAVLWVKTHDMK